MVSSSLLCLLHFDFSVFKTRRKFKVSATDESCTFIKVVIQIMEKYFYMN